MPTHSPDSFHQITDVLARSLKTAFDEVCPERYGRPLSIQRIDTDDEHTVVFHIHGPKAITIPVHVTVSHVGGNVYDIGTQVQDGPIQTFTYSEPDSSGSSLSLAPYLGKKIARHVLNEVEQSFGKILLRKQIKSGP